MAIASLPGQPWISGEVLCCFAVGNCPQDLSRGSFAMSLEPEFQSLRALGRALLSHLVLKGAGQLCLPADDAYELIPVGVGQLAPPSFQPTRCLASFLAWVLNPIDPQRGRWVVG